MFTAEPASDRWLLGFAEVVKSSFAFVKLYGLERVLEEVTLVRYQSEIVMLTVYHGRGSYELGVEFERMEFPGEKFSLYEVLERAKQAGKIVKIPTGGYQTSSREGVQKLVPRIADLVKKYAGPLLRGDATVYQALRQHQSEEAAKYTKEIHLRTVRRKTQAAWSQRDYEKVVESLSSIRDDLTNSEKMKLAYAEKHFLLPTGDSRHAVLRKKY